MNNRANSLRSDILLFLRVLGYNVIIFVILGATLYMAVPNRIDLSEIGRAELQSLMLQIATIVCGVNAFIFITIGWFKTIFWYIRMAQNTLPEVRWYKPIRNPGNAIYRPQYLTDIGREYRLKLLSGIRFLLAGVVLGLMTFGLQEMKSWGNVI